MRYGPKRIAAVLGLVALVTLSAFGVREYLHRQNDYMLRSIKTKTFELVNETKLTVDYTVPIIIQQLILGNITVGETIDAVTDTLQKIKIATGIASQLVAQGRYEPGKIILQSLTIADSLLEKLPIPGDTRKLSDGLKLVHDFSVSVGLAGFFNPDEVIHSFVIRNARRSARWALHIFKEQPAGFDNIQLLSLALDNGINHKIFSGDEINQLLNILSTFENTARTPWLEKNYKRDKVLIRGGYNYGPRFNGLYQDLAYLYAAAGNTGKVLQCVDTLLFYQDGFYQKDYATHIENACNIAAVFCTYGTTAGLDEFVRGYCNLKKSNAEEFYNRLISRSWVDDNLNSNLNGSNQKFSNLNLKLQTDSMLSFFFSKLKKEVLKINEPDERNFKLAVFFKNKGILQAYRKEIQGKVETDSDYQEAIQNYQLVKKEYRDQLISVVSSSGTDSISMPRKFLFLYPDYRVPFHLNEPRKGSIFYNSASFVNYVLDHQFFDVLYENIDELRYFELWFRDYLVCMSSRDWYLRDRMPFALIEGLASALEKRKSDQSLDLNILYLQLADQAFDMQEPGKGIMYLQRVQADKLLNSFQGNNFSLFGNAFVLVGKAMANLTLNNQFDLAYKLLNVFKKELNRSSLYGVASNLVSKTKRSKEKARQLLDSARLEMNRLEKPTVFRPDRLTGSVAMMYFDPDEKSTEAYSTIKNAVVKYVVISTFSKAYAFHGNLYKALQQAPPLISKEDLSGFLSSSVAGFNLATPPKKEWMKFNDNMNYFNTTDYLVYMNENE